MDMRIVVRFLARNACDRRHGQRVLLNWCMMTSVQYREITGLRDCMALMGNGRQFCETEARDFHASDLLNGSN